MRRRFMMTVIAISLAGFGCKKKDESKAEPTPASDPAQPADPEPTADEPIDPVPPGEAGEDAVDKMSNCPSAVEGAKTTVAKGDGVVTVDVTVDGDEAVAEVRKRATYLAGLEVTDDDLKHDSAGHGGGGLGRCPIVMKDTRVEATEIDGGARVTLTPTEAAGLDALADEATKRAAELADGGARGGADSGGGSGGHGSGTGGGNGRGGGQGGGVRGLPTDSAGSTGGPSEAGKKSPPRKSRGKDTEKMDSEEEEDLGL